MSFVTDIRNVSDSALNQLAERFNDLPRPLLAAIGAGDFAIERLAELREALAKSVRTSTPGTTDVQKLAGDLPAKLNLAASDVFQSVQKFAAQAPAKTQQLVSELPAKATDVRESMTPEQLKAAVDGYTQLANAIYGSLADRGDKTWSKVAATAGYDAKVVTTTVRSAAGTATGVVKRATGQAAESAADADVKARAATASGVHAENAAARKAGTAGHAAKPARKPAAKPAAKGAGAHKASTARRSAASKPATTTAKSHSTAKPAPKPVHAATETTTAE